MRKLIALFLVMLIGGLNTGLEGQGKPTIHKSHKLDYDLDKMTTGAPRVSHASVQNRNNIYGAGDKHYIYKWNFPQNKWVRWRAASNTRKKLFRVSVASDGKMWALRRANAIDEWLLHRGKWNWHGRHGGAKRISVGRKAHKWVFIVGMNNLIYHHPIKPPGRWYWHRLHPTDTKGNKFKVKDISVASDDSLWAIGTDDKIYASKVNTTPPLTRGRHPESWTLVPGLLRQISVGSKTQIYGVNNAYNVYRRNVKESETGGSWSHIASKFRQVDVAEDGTLWGIGTDRHTYRINNSFFGTRFKIIDDLHALDIGNKNFYQYNTFPELEQLYRFSFRQKQIFKEPAPTESKFFKNHFWQAWYASQGGRFRTDINALRTARNSLKNTRSPFRTKFSGPALLARMKLKYYEHLADYTFNKQKVHEPFKNIANLNFFMRRLARFVNNRNELIQFAQDNKPMTKITPDMQTLFDQRVELHKEKAESREDKRIRREKMRKLHMDIRVLGYKKEQYGQLEPLIKTITYLESKVNDIVYKYPREKTLAEQKQISTIEYDILEKLITPKTRDERKNWQKAKQLLRILKRLDRPLTSAEQTSKADAKKVIAAIGLRLPDLREKASKLIPMREVFRKTKRQLNKRIYIDQKRIRWINRLRYLVNNMFGPEFTRMLKPRLRFMSQAFPGSEQPGATGVALMPPTTPTLEEYVSPLEKLFNDLSTKLTSFTSADIMWRADFKPAIQLSLLGELIGTGLERIKQEKARMIEARAQILAAKVKTFMDFVAETAARPFLITAISPGDNQTMLFKNLETLSKQVTARPLNEIESYLGLIDKLEDYLIRGWFTFDPPARKTTLERYIARGKQLYLTLLKDIGTRGKIIAAAGDAASADPAERTKYADWLKTASKVVNKLIAKETRTPAEISVLKNLLTQLNDPNTGLKGLFPLANQPDITQLIAKLETTIPAMPITPSVTEPMAVSTETLTKAFDDVRKAFNYYDTNVHATPEMRAQWLSNFEMVVKNRMMLKQQDLFNALIANVKETTEETWLAAEWLDLFSAEQQTKLKELIAEGEKPLDYAALFSYFQKSRTNLPPAVLIDLVQKILQHPDSRLEKNKGRQNWLTREAQDEANERFSETEKTQLNAVLKTPGVAPPPLPAPGITPPPSIPLTIAEQIQLWRNQVATWNRQILNWRGAGIPTMNKKTANSVKSQMATTRKQIDQLDLQAIPADLRTQLTTAKTALTGLQQQVQNRLDTMPKPPRRSRRSTRGTRGKAQRRPGTRR